MENDYTWRTFINIANEYLNVYGYHDPPDESWLYYYEQGYDPEDAARDVMFGEKEK